MTVLRSITRYTIYKNSSAELERVLKRLNPMLGRKVRHPDFGFGTVVGLEGIGDDRRISVSFPGRGTKKFIESYLQLE
jgi:hypothetical protein